MDSYIRLCKHRLTGIINGLDETIYNPAKDPFIPFTYTKSNVFSRKAANKESLQERLGLPVNRNIPMLAIVSRLIEDKGMDLIMRIMDELMMEEVQLIILGTGDWPYEEGFRHLAPSSETFGKILFVKISPLCIARQISYLPHE